MIVNGLVTSRTVHFNHSASTFAPSRFTPCRLAHGFLVRCKLAPYVKAQSMLAPVVRVYNGASIFQRDSCLRDSASQPRVTTRGIPDGQDAEDGSNVCKCHIQLASDLRNSPFGEILAKMSFSMENNHTGTVLKISKLEAGLATQCQDTTCLRS